MNFDFVPWGRSVEFSAFNATALSTKFGLFLCLSDFDGILELYRLAHNNYRACAGTKPYKLTFGTPNPKGKNDGAFWFDSSVNPASVRDGLSQTAFFSERCLGDSARPDPLSDYYITDPTLSTCLNAGRVDRRAGSATSNGRANAGGTEGYFTQDTIIFLLRTNRAVISATTIIRARSW